MLTDLVYTKVIVRSVGAGAAPLAWKVAGTNPGTPLYFMSDRFRSTEAAYRVGLDRLTEFLPDNPANRGKRERPAGRQTSAPVIDWHADEAAEAGMDGDWEVDGAAGQDAQSDPAMLEVRAD